MKSLARSTVILLSSLFLVTILSAQPITKSFSARQGQRLSLDLRTGGDISISGWEKSEVSVIARPEGRDAKDIEVEFDERGSGISIQSRYKTRRNNHNGSLNLEIKVPKRFDVDLNTMGGGVSITGVEGNFEGETMGGGIDLTELKGEANLQTMGGSITVKNSDLDGNVKTMGGEVQIDNVSGNLNGSTMGGNVQYRNVRRPGGNASGEEVRISTMGGAINVDDAPAGAIVNTMGGNIHVRSAAEYVKAKTMGGDIDIDEVNGWVEATTMGGDVTVVMTGNPNAGDRHVTITSMGGDILLTVPDGLPMELDLEITYTKDSDETYTITSDFDVEIDETEEWIRDHGNLQKRIYGTGTVGNGKNRIKIETINGNIALKNGR